MVLNPHPIYPSAGRYVLRLHRDARPGLGQLFGRIEHVASGDGIDFTSAAHLLNWLTHRALQEPVCVQEPGQQPTPKENQ